MMTLRESPRRVSHFTNISGSSLCYVIVAAHYNQITKPSPDYVAQATSPFASTLQLSTPEDAQTACTTFLQQFNHAIINIEQSSSQVEKINANYSIPPPSTLLTNLPVPQPKHVDLSSCL